MSRNVTDRSAADVSVLSPTAGRLPVDAAGVGDPVGRPAAARAVGSRPTLIRCFARAGGPTQRRPIPPEGLLLGRDIVVFDDPFRDARMASRHAELCLDDSGRVVIRDLGSPQGTFVNGQAVTGERPLENADVVRVGDTVLVYATGLADPDPNHGGLVGSSAAMAAVRRSIVAVAPRRHAVVITGETGTGKEIVARQLHEHSGRTGPFIAVNCSTFTDALLASELFGHVRGAFTGAVSDHLGLFRAARGGTLLLDELADIPMAVQASLLRVLETRTVRPVGATKDVEVDVRVLATSNRDLVELVQQGKFRADLYARLAQWTIRTPRLRERREDIPDLVAHLLPRVDGAGRRLTADLWEALLLHGWPLNVRGLLNVLSIAVVSSPDEDSPLALTPEVDDALQRTRTMTPDAAPEREPAAAPRSDTVARPAWAPPRTLDRKELEGLMMQFQGHVAAAARHVGMTRPKLYRMLGAYGLEPGEFRRRRTGGC